MGRLRYSPSQTIETFKEETSSYELVGRRPGREPIWLCPVVLEDNIPIFNVSLESKKSISQQEIKATCLPNDNQFYEHQGRRISLPPRFCVEYLRKGEEHSSTVETLSRTKLPDQNTNKCTVQKAISAGDMLVEVHFPWNSFIVGQAPFLHRARTTASFDKSFSKYLSQIMGDHYIDHQLFEHHAQSYFGTQAKHDPWNSDSNKLTASLYTRQTDVFGEVRRYQIQKHNKAPDWLYGIVKNYDAVVEALKQSPRLQTLVNYAIDGKLKIPDTRKIQEGKMFSPWHEYKSYAHKLVGNLADVMMERSIRQALAGPYDLEQWINDYVTKKGDKNDARKVELLVQYIFIYHAARLHKYYVRVEQVSLKPQSIKPIAFNQNQDMDEIFTHLLEKVSDDMTKNERKLLIGVLTYILLSKSWEKHRFSLRYDDYKVTDLDVFQVEDNNNEEGIAATLAYLYNPTKRHQIAFEYLYIDSHRANRVEIGENTQAYENIFQIGWRYQP